MSHIVSLRSENVKRIKAVSIKPDGSLVVIGGRNRAGKSSVLDSIAMALGGKKAVCEEPLRKGEKKGRTVVKLDNGLTVTRTYTKEGSYLTVEDQMGKVKSPQALLDKMVGPISFDPLAFSRMDSKEQATLLKALVGLDFSELDRKRQAAYDERTAVNRELKGAGARLEAMPIYEDAPAEPVVLANLLADLDAKKGTNSENESLRLCLDEERAEAGRVVDEIAKLAETIEERKRTLADLIDKGKILAERVAGLKDEDTDEALNAISMAEETNAQVRANIEFAKAQEALEPLKDQTDELTEILKRIDKEKAEALAGADFPVDGLAFDADGVTYNGLPFAQASGAENLRVSMAMGLAMSPDFPVVLIRDGSLLDEDSLRMVAEMSEEAGGQVWLEKVTTDQGACSIIISDGMVKGGGE